MSRRENMSVHLLLAARSAGCWPGLDCSWSFSSTGLNTSSVGPSSPPDARSCLSNSAFVNVSNLASSIRLRRLHDDPCYPKNKRQRTEVSVHKNLAIHVHIYIIPISIHFVAVMQIRHLIEVRMSTENRLGLGTRLD